MHVLKCIKFTILCFLLISWSGCDADHKLTREAEIYQSMLAEDYPVYTEFMCKEISKALQSYYSIYNCYPNENNYSKYLSDTNWIPKNLSGYLKAEHVYDANGVKIIVKYEIDRIIIKGAGMDKKYYSTDDYEFIYKPNHPINVCPEVSPNGADPSAP